MTIRILPCLILFAASLHAAPARLFVEPFVTKSGAEKLREDVVAELRKLPAVALVNAEAGADLVLGGGGEIWIRGYQSLNPRSSRQPGAGTPVYGGYLSVELRDSKGVTVWSYLATPGAETQDVAKDLSRSIAKHVAEALQHHAAEAPPAPATPPGTTLKGAGATFPWPVYEKWFASYRRVDPHVEISYEPVGSEAGVRRLLKSEIDFGASDSPMAIHDMQPADESRYLFIPAVAGAVVPIVNLPGVTGELAFTPEALAGIYLGKITKWNDPVLRAANRGLRLPDLDIVAVHRAEGSGTSYAFADFLSTTVPEWKDRVGTGLAPKWPVGRPAEGNDGVAKLVKELGGSIGYVEFIYALRNQLSYGKVRNSSGEYVAASLESIETAVRTRPQSPGAYPMTSFTWFVVPAKMPDEAKRKAMAGFLAWMLGPGQAQAAALGYAALPKDVVTKELATIQGLGR